MAERETDIYPLNCRECDNTGTLTFWRDEDGHWGVEWIGFIGREALLSLPRRARGKCRACGSMRVQVGERAAAE
ncbi:MAG: hypothetical protein WDN03_17125 [Rhizomicrobium sp.]